MERVTAVAAMPDLIDRERIETFLSVTQERVAMLQAITAEREALLAALASERATVIDALHEERVGTLKDAEASARRLIDYTLIEQVEVYVNHVLLRVFLGVVALILLVFGAALFVMSVGRRRGRLAGA
jgi:hypothetical protein